MDRIVDALAGSLIDRAGMNCRCRQPGAALHIASAVLSDVDHLLAFNSPTAAA